jgi:hypothetical protein
MAVILVGTLTTKPLIFLEVRAGGLFVIIVVFFLTRQGVKNMFFNLLVVGLYLTGLLGGVKRKIAQSTLKVFFNIFKDFL